jgi:hypothetical protein
MSLADTQKLTQMIKDAPDQVAGLESSIDSVTDSISELTDQRSGIQNGVCVNAKNLMIAYITANLLPLYPVGSYIKYGSGFGTIGFGTGNISAWGIYLDVVTPNPTPPPPTITTPTLLYPYTPGDYPEIDQWVDDYDFGNDYITRPLTDGATYGLTPNIETLGIGKSILQENQDKISDSIDVFSRYAT